MAEVVLSAPSSPTEPVALWGCSRHACQLSAQAHPELVLTASQLQRIPEGFAGAGPAVFMDVPLP